MRRLGMFAVLLTGTTALLGPAACSDQRETFGVAETEAGGPGPLLGDASAADSTSDDAQGQPCHASSTEDLDGDGYSIADGDCNDCDPNANPGAYDIAANGRDEDCSGTADDEPTACDTEIPIDSADPLDGARALGLCRSTTSDATGKARTWGVIRARYLQPDRTPEVAPLSHGILPDFGPNFLPFEGKRVLSLSTGYARRIGDVADAAGVSHDKRYSSGAPSGFPHAPPACPEHAGGQPYDGAGLELTIRVPTNANSFTFAHMFFTTEYPEYYCTDFNDVYVVLMSPKITHDGNIAFDRDGNGVSVNSVLLDICKKYPALPPPCAKGNGQLVGTIFEGYGATSWLTTTAAVQGGSEITLFFTMWDSADGVRDSTILADDFQWSAAEADPLPTTVVR